MFLVNVTGNVFITKKWNYVPFFALHKKNFKVMRTNHFEVRCTQPFEKNVTK